MITPNSTENAARACSNHRMGMKSSELVWAPGEERRHEEVGDGHDPIAMQVVYECPTCKFTTTTDYKLKTVTA